MKLESLKVHAPAARYGAWAAYHWSGPMEDRLNVLDRNGEPLRLTRRMKDWLLVPRALCPTPAKGGPTDVRSDGSPINVRSYVVPRNAQQANVIAESKALLSAGESFVLQADTGQGKTVVACELIAHVKRKTLVIVPKDDLVDQWAKALGQFLHLTPDKIGLIRGPKCSIDGKPVVIGMLKSLGIEGKYPKAIRQAFGFVIWDEVHTMPAPTFSTTGGLFAARLRLGLSATPKRYDDRQILALAHIGPVMVRSKGVPMVPVVAIYRSPWRCPRRQDPVTGLMETIPHSATKCGHVLNMLVTHPKRNALIVERIVAAYRASRHVAVFSDRRAHLELLRAAALAEGIPAQHTTLYVHGMTKAEKAGAATKRVIFATYGMMGVGTDIDTLDVGILATPRSNIKQPVGRIVRAKAGKPKPVIVDIADLDSPVFKSWVKGRLRIYRELTADVKACGGLVLEA